MTSELESGLIVPIPEAEPVVARWRHLLDSSAPLGVPAHVTVLYPFLPPDAIDGDVRAEVREFFAGVAAFDVVFADVRWFGEAVVYAAPESDQPFRTMTSRLVTRWPECPPYGGAHGEPTPHLTIGDHGETDLLQEAAVDVALRLPVAGRAGEAWLMAGSADTRWEKLEVFPFAG